MIRCLLVVCDSPDAEVVAEFGDFVSWFGVPLEARAELVVADPRRGQIAPPLLDTVDAVLVTGSRASAYSAEPWIGELRALVREAVVERELPYLGVCFGHQVLALALGGTVAPNPRGMELGTIDVTLNEAGSASPLFEGLPSRFAAQALHADTVARLPDGARLLGRSDADDHQAFVWGSAFGVQFHPEVRAEMLARYLQMNGPRLRERGLDPDGLFGVLRPTPGAARVLTNFVRFASNAR